MSGAYLKEENEISTGWTEHEARVTIQKRYSDESLVMTSRYHTRSHLDVYQCEYFYVSIWTTF